VDGVRQGGQRRIDRVLAGDYLAGLATLPLAEVRGLRDEADQEETDLSYLRRLLQGRLDLVRAEIDRRSSGAARPADFVAELTRVLTDPDRPAAQGLGRYRPGEPSRAGDSRRHVESLVSDADLSDVGARSDLELGAVQDTLAQEEAHISERRKAVQAVLDAASAEIARRYRDGEADVASLLGRGGHAGG
jgi:hypothetical protein